MRHVESFQPRGLLLVVPLRKRAGLGVDDSFHAEAEALQMPRLPTVARS